MNITLSVDEKVVKKARKLARDRGTSLNQLIRDHLEQLVQPEDGGAFASELRRLTREGQGRAAGWRFDRGELHGRR